MHGRSLACNSLITETNKQLTNSIGCINERIMKTAVEWIISKLSIINDNDPYLAHLIKQAKELEKQQIIEAYIDGKEKGFNKFDTKRNINQ